MILFKWLINGRYKIEEFFLEEEKKLCRKKINTFNKKQLREINKKVKEIINNIFIRHLFFIIIEVILMIFFTYFIIAFCAVYQGTQLSWLLDSLTSLLFSTITELIITLFASGIYSSSLRYKIELLCNIALFIYKIM